MSDLSPFVACALLPDQGQTLRRESFLHSELRLALMEVAVTFALLSVEAYLSQHHLWKGQFFPCWVVWDAC